MWLCRVANSMDQRILFSPMVNVTSMCSIHFAEHFLLHCINIWCIGLTIQSTNAALQSGRHFRGDNGWLTQSSRGVKEFFIFYHDVKCTDFPFPHEWCRPGNAWNPGNAAHTIAPEVFAICLKCQYSIWCSRNCCQCPSKSEPLTVKQSIVWGEWKCQCHLHEQQCKDWMCSHRRESRTVHPHHWWLPHYYPLEP